MTILSTIYYAVLIVSAVLCVLNIIRNMIGKRTFRMLTNFVWAVLLIVTFVTTWIYFQGFLYGNYTGWLPEFDHIMWGISEGNTLAKVVLLCNALSLIVLVIYVIVLINRLINGVNKAVDKTANAISDGVDNVKSKFAKKEKATAETEADAHREADTAIELKLDDKLAELDEAEKNEENVD